MIKLAMPLKPGFFGCDPIAPSMPVVSRLASALRERFYRRHRVIMGANVAMHSFFEAALRYSCASEVVIFTHPTSVTCVTRALNRNLAALASRRISVRAYGDLVGERSYRGFNNWFDLALNFAPAGSLRSEYPSAPFAISATHHTISYRGLLYDRILPILLTETLPCDSLVCATSASRIALVRLLDYVKREFNEAHGTDLSYGGRFETIPWGVDTDRFRPAEKKFARKQLGLPRDGLILLYLGRLSPVDKADLLPFLQVFNRLCKANRGQRLHLVLAGTQAGDYVTSIYKHASSLDLTRLIKVIENPKQPSVLYAASDIFVSPVDNIQESFGLVILEALASGLPQVVPDWNGYRDLVSHGKSGFLVPTYWTKCDADLCLASPFFSGDEAFDHISLAQSVAIDLNEYERYLTILIKNPELRASMGEQARLSAISNFSWCSVIKRFDSLWEESAQIASRLAGRTLRRRCYARPAYFESFGHYATLHLGAHFKLRLTVLGREALESRGLLRSYVPARTWDLLDEHMLRSTLAGLDRLAPLNEKSPAEVSMAHECTLGGLIQLLGDADHPANEDARRRHLMWLIKYGFIEAAESAPH